MTAVDNIRNYIQNYPVISRNTTFIDNCDFINLSAIEKGILIVYVSWSPVAIENFRKTIKSLAEYNYNDAILIVDNDIMNPDFQLQNFGEVCHGWGEIFVINGGQILKRFLGRNAFQAFKNYLAECA